MGGIHIGSLAMGYDLHFGQSCLVYDNNEKYNHENLNFSSII